MRILIKGGVWKNSEDEILKAAVMKYGKNQWARVASLLSRKSAKQCKTRWYEWLDPSIKKTEWTREEEEKLLHMAKLMPNQWRTIAPIVGRTAGQCIEQYEKLLDQAQPQDSEMAIDDPRRLRPGEIDPTPESKPARPDPIDMDEDEKEMLSEARARLANTKGKKAKRKARERMLEESRRLALLQKRRELKAAGVESRLGVKRGSKYIDYAREIPFQHVAPSGFYDVSSENDISNSMKLDPKSFGLELSKMEGRHDKEEEERLKKKDKDRLKSLFKENAPQAIMKVSAANDPVALRKRGTLDLPAPQVTENELEEIAKLSKDTLMPPPLEGRGATRALIGDYTQVFQPSATPLRTPQQEDVIMQEAKNLRALREMTPLVAQELPELYEGTGFGGVAPRKQVMATPNSVLTFSQNTPARPAIPGTPMTMSGTSVKSGKSVVLRDQFGLNASSDSLDTFSVSEMSGMASSISSVFKKTDRQALLSQLNALPEPEYTYEVSIPQVMDDDVETSRMFGKPEDSYDIERRAAKRKAEEMERELSRRSLVLQKGLPRPEKLSSLEVTSSIDPQTNSPELVSASKAINQETIKLILYENEKYPYDNSIEQGPPSNYETIDRYELNKAQCLIDNELQFMTTPKPVITNAEWEYLQSIALVQDKNNQFKVSSEEIDLTNSYKAQFHFFKSQFDTQSKKIRKMENKIQILTKGYSSRMEQLFKGIEHGNATLSQSQLDHNSLFKVHEQETKIIQSRLQRVRREANDAESFDHASQEKYASLVRYAKDQGLIL